MAMDDAGAGERIALSGEGLQVDLITFGAAIASLTVEMAGGPRQVVLGFSRTEDYVAHSPYFGAIAGRCANRIRGGRFVLDGRSHQLDLNEAGRTHLHGGKGGFPRRTWTIGAVSAREAVLTLRSEDGDQGYPGAVDVTCRYAITAPRELTIDLSARPDAPTLVNLAPHSYFNLDGSESVLDHRLTIHADAYTPTDADQIPTGEIVRVAGTPFDFRTARPIRHAVDGGHIGYDHNFVVSMEPVAAPRPVALLEGGLGDLSLEVLSTEPGLQVYDGLHLGGVPIPLADGRTPTTFGAICLEPQLFPDAVNQPGFLPPVLRPGAEYRHTTVYRFHL